MAFSHYIQVAYAVLLGDRDVLLTEDCMSDQRDETKFAAEMRKFVTKISNFCSICIYMYLVLQGQIQCSASMYYYLGIIYILSLD